MKKILALPVCVLWALVWLPTTLLASAEGTPLGMPDFSHSGTALTVSRGTPAHTVISLTSPEVLILDTVDNFEEYQLFHIPGESFDYRDGHPAVPQVTRLYRIPNTGSVELQVGTLEYDELTGVNPYPLQLEELRFQTPLVKDAAVYRTNDWYPRDVVVMGEPMIMRDFRVVAVTLYPVQVNPVTGEARVYTRMDVELTANSQPGENELLRTRPISRDFAQIYRNVIANLDESELDDVTMNPGSYLIISKDTQIANRWSDSLAVWKRRLGYTVTIERRTEWNPGTIFTTISNAYDAANPPLEYVCLMGDAAGGQIHGVPTNNSTYDHGYAILEGNDHLEDIGIGRLPAQDDEEFATIFAKLMAYERSPNLTNPAWFGRAFLYAGTSTNFSSNEITMRWARQQFQRFTGVDSIRVQTHQGHVSPTDIAIRLNEGVSYFLWRGTVVGEMSAQDVDATNNGNKLPVCLTITCGSGDFNIDHPCVSESWILAGTPNSLKGAVCGIGTATWGTHVQYNNTVAGGLVYSICNLGIEHLGLALSSAKAQLLSAFPDPNDQAVSFINWNNLMGDPSLQLWTQAPVVMDATYPGTVDVGTRRIRPQVVNHETGDPIQDALVVLWKGDECLVKAFTDAGGFADVPVTVNTEGTMSITVSKRNHAPVLGNILCVNATQMVTYLSHTIDDDNVGGSSGNGDGLLNPGETVDLGITLQNFGTSQTATTVSATLSCSDPDILVNQPTCNYPDMAAGQTAVSASQFRIFLEPDMPHQKSVILTLSVTASGQTTHSSIRVTCDAGDAIYMQRQLIGGNGDNYLQPGEEASLVVTVRNAGTWAMNGVTAQLQSTTSYVTVSDGDGTYNNIAPGTQQANSNNMFVVVANPIAYPGFPAEMLLVLTTASGFVDSVRFILPLGQRAATDPTGPDTYGYFAYDNSDTEYESSRPFSYLNISSLGTRLPINDPGIEAPGGLPYSVALRLPFQFTFYGQTYDTITVCSNGWAAFGNQAEQDQFRNYPIPGQQAPNALLAPFWDDLQTSGDTLGVWTYFQADSHRFVVQWKARGVSDASDVRQDFELMLLDEEHYPTRDGNGIVIYQYGRIQDSPGYYNDVDYATIGIQAPGSLVGLQYRFNNTAEPGGASLIAGRSIVFTTESRADFGAVQGVVTDQRTGAAMTGVSVSLDGLPGRDTTDAQGHYEIPNILIGTYMLRARAFGYNDATVANTVIYTDSTVTADIQMLHPEINLTVDEIHVSLPDNPATTSFAIENDGNGPLDFGIHVSYAPAGPLDDPWAYLNGIDVSGAVNDLLIQGCEFAGDTWWVSGGNGGQGAPNFYRFDLDGNLVATIPQPATGGFGWFDMAWDGNLVYGSNGPVILGVDLNGVVQDTIPSPLNPTRALAYDPATDHFWVADYLTDIMEIDRDGNILRRFASTQHVTGLAWFATDALGYRLYIFGRDNASQHAKVWRMHPVSGQAEFVVNLDRMPGDLAGGCAVTPSWNSTVIVFGGILQNPSGDRLGIWELDFNTTWISVAPMFGTVAANNTREIELRFDPATLRNATYHVNLTITNNSAESTVVLPVSLTVALAAEPEPGVLVEDYALHQNYPNPFNGQTTFRYDLKQPGFTRLTIHNLLGQQVAEVVRGFEDAGAHMVNFNTAGMASGVYLYTLRSGEFTETRKLMLLK